MSKTKKCEPIPNGEAGAFSPKGDLLRWMEPPPIRHGGGKPPQEWLATLRQHPKKWALIRRRKFPISTTFFKRHFGYEFIVRHMADGDYGLFARYVGGTARG